ncbi:MULTISPECIES: DsbE family thiol:disulfide interchange protein [Roseobacteraceae]|uniref:Cytochrome c biogenesis protein CcmG, thiol:disulfide interchange protein DsbE n=2 Tax=Roseobacteraceae TaxID=2854170 RepID=A0A1H9X0X2_9RHOB|nr:MULTISPECIES: DsbE family thiol:disulfide interchange protein [Roseobacteraceae]SES39848.1 cytochrome c biogenesis protein CcmG, thiol:disulfide interchange protein DsbE [Tranquillimonas rosea]SFE86607.1 cytochrome c biogenesis protein CcmG, thiol:disulfide interchange protein DsbE [Roseivivax sediminis]
MTNVPKISRKPRLSLLVVVPLLATLLFAVFAWGLFNSSEELPSALLNKSVPEFDLPPVQGRETGLSTSDLAGHVSLVNVFASWCVPCRQEHPIFMAMSKRGEVPIYGINYKDPPDQAAAWLGDLGDPYTRIGADLDGRVGIEWGVYGIPETYVIAANGTIAYRHVGPLTQSDIDNTMLPLARELQQRQRNQ